MWGELDFVESNHVDGLHKVFETGDRLFQPVAAHLKYILSATQQKHTNAHNNTLSSSTTQQICSLLMP